MNEHMPFFYFMAFVSLLTRVSKKKTKADDHGESND